MTAPGTKDSAAYRAERAEILRRLGANLRQARLAANHTQESLSLACNLHRTDVGEIERAAREPRFVTLLILANALGVTLEDLAKGIPIPKERRPPTHSGPQRP
jgi:transcriptional regulator with XRE-family HTH domain